MMDALARCDFYLRHWLTERLSPSEQALLLSIGEPVAIHLTDHGVEREWTLLQTSDGLTFPQRVEPRCRYGMSVSTFERIASSTLSPQWAAVTGKLRIEGDKLLGVRIGGLLSSVFQRIPWDGSVEVPPQTRSVAHTGDAPLTDRQREVIALHFDETHGAPWWIERSRALGLQARNLQTRLDLAILGPFDRRAAALRPWRDFVPNRVLESGGEITLGETGGLTGSPMTSAWTAHDFRAAFIDPLVEALSEWGVEPLRQWLFVGPTGPHIIGKAADAIARATTGTDALKVDFDPRWHRAMHPDSPAARRHMEHLLAQAETILVRERPDALFVTPSVLQRLFERIDGASLRALKLVHLGGQSLMLDERERLLSSLPDGCRMINGYGNSLFGCVVEESRRPLHYRVRGERLVIELIEEPGKPETTVGDGATGRVMFHRFDETMMILNGVERDVAERTGDGISSPRPAREAVALTSGGIY